MWSLALSLVVMSLTSPGGGEEACSSTFQVWQPDQDVLNQIEHVHLAVQNLTFFCQAQTAKTETKMAEQMTQIHNTTWRLERDILSMRVTRMDAELQNAKMATDLNNIKRDLEDYDRRVDDLELDLYMLRDNVKDTGPRFERAELSTDMASMLKNSVGDLKAEWLLMKREIEGLKRESRRMQHQRGEELDSGQRLSREMQTVSGSLQSLQKRTSLTQGLLQRLETRINKVVADCLQVRDSLLDVKTERDAQDTELSTLHEANVRLQKLLQELQEQTRRLQERQEALQTHAISLARTGENSPDILLRNPSSSSFIPRDCHELYQMGRHMSGVYHIQPSGAPYMLPVYCLMLNGTGHTVIQRRVDGLLNFNRRWLEYQHGFGNPYGELWIGNDVLHLLTHQKHYILWIDLTDWEGRRYWAQYSQFLVADSSQYYRLRVSGYTGDAGDSLSLHDKMAFSTEDVDNDLHMRHCAAENQGGWWFNSCFASNLNGVYHRAWYSQAASSYSDGVVWVTAKDSEFYSMKAVTMMLKPKTP